MPHSNRSSSASAHCPPDATGVRLEWRPSQVLCAVVLLLGIFGAFALVSCEMPRWYAIPLALASIAEGARLARRHARERRHVLAWSMEGALTVDGVRIQSATVQWRGPLAFLRWVDGQGRHHRLAWWPDTLSRGSRRELRLAAASAAQASGIASMAP